MRAKVFFAPKLLASIQAVMFTLSSGVTAMNKSTPFTPASVNAVIEVGEPT